MKRLIYLEIILLAALLLVAVVACSGLISPTPSPEGPTGTTAPVTQPTTLPATQPTTFPTVLPTTFPTTQPTTQPTTGPTTRPTTVPTTEPTTEPTTTPTLFVPTWKTYPDNREIRAKQYFVYDLNNNTFLISSGQQSERIYPASITKLFTAYVGLQHLPLDTKITAGSVLDLLDPDSSVAGIWKGDTLTVQQLVAAMMLPSGNDAAYILACEAGRVIAQNPQLNAATAVRVFMDRVNQTATELGMTGTHFVTPDGIHDNNHYTTFGDLAVIGKLALSNPTIRQCTATAKQTVTLHGETLQWKNTNHLIDPASSYYCPYAIGLKTGRTGAAGTCLLSAFHMGETELLIGVFGCDVNSDGDRFDDTLDLFNRIVLN